ncbi:UDP-glycosyltransferase [Salinimicrobium tongyeongense]|uniref:UDP-glycosyltransferase n=1 Tax=Salinimicrobium tongyeongense TaxID=2809707 RepID=A0ABY6NT42_9FLAO|nr:UDP-glycosyltransferase [Salinimicrobium tongyeongense]UZH55648.1 UDP-glycosyltransferase [Salinimicrobium tongyeongense]
MKPKKIFILLPDGIGLKNFAFTSFAGLGKKMGWEVVFWNATPFDLEKMGYREIKLQGSPRPKTDLLKRAKIKAELDLFTEKFNDPVYQTYKFHSPSRRIKEKIKDMLVSHYKFYNGSENGLRRLRKGMQASEKKGNYYRDCLEVLKKEKPDFIFCTNQRPITAIAPLTAAKDLRIKTGTFIFSWDNLPKATMVIEPDHYFVWSEHMQRELLKYYPFVKKDQIHITGSPQFEPHFDPTLRRTRAEFFKENGLDEDKEYICFSGDDVTTSPHDPQYLEDVAGAVQVLNQKNYNLGIIFRRNPVDHSDRYDWVLKEFEDIIVPLDPKWKEYSSGWNNILPTQKDVELQINTILHTKAVTNLGSSMVFDYVVFKKPCLFINYNLELGDNSDWSVEKVYNFVHFRSMPSKKAVFWLNSKEEISEKLKYALSATTVDLEETKKWFQKINVHPPHEASERIWKEIENIVVK